MRLFQLWLHCETLMPLETGTYVPDLVPTNPVHTDGLNQADSHIRLIKSTLKATFANFTDVALNSTQAAIDAAVASVTGLATTLFPLGSAAAPSIAPIADTDTGLWSPGADKLAVSCNGAQVVEWTAAGESITGNLSASGSMTAASFVGGSGQLLPLGGACLWFTTSLPAGNFAWCNGQAVSRTTYATLFALIGTAYGSGDGSTTFNLPDLRERIPVCQSTLGGTTAPGLITQYDPSVQGHTFGEANHHLLQAELPSYTVPYTEPNSGQGHQHVGASTGAQFLTNASSGSQLLNSSSPGASPVSDTAFATTGITIHSGGSDTPHNVVQPSLVCSWVMRIL